jgi:hypothetical protein
MEQLLRHPISSLVISFNPFASGGPGGKGRVLPISNVNTSLALVKDAIVPPNSNTRRP